MWKEDRSENDFETLLLWSGELKFSFKKKENTKAFKIKKNII
jgi:hypothetical protein